jgi:hypothetical protein
MPNASVSIQFDADNPGVWPLHCHILYHLEAGMFTVVRYKDFIQPLQIKKAQFWPLKFKSEISPLAFLLQDPLYL